MENQNKLVIILSTYGMSVAGIIGIFVIWEILVKTLSVPLYVLPPPSRIFLSGMRNAGALWSNGLVTLGEILIGFCVSIVVAIPIAICIVYSKFLQRLIWPPLVASQSIPKIAVAPLFVLWFGFGPTSKVVVSFLISFFPIVVDTVVGMNSIDPSMIHLGKSMGASGLQIFTKFRLPHALPNIFGGLKVAVTLAVVGAITGEFVGADAGLGYLLLVANGNLDTRLLFADIFILSFFGILLFNIVGLVEMILVPHAEQARTLKEVTKRS